MAGSKSTQVARPASRRTKAQEKAVQADGKNILVSASAGTGKTRVLVDRCLRLVLDKGVDLDRLLVVTFTDAAAAEMRERIRGELQARLEEDMSSQRLRSQLLFLDRAQISTIHSFCLNTLRENFHRLGLDPDFAVIDPDEVDLLKTEVAAELFENCYSRKDEKGGQFQRLVDCYGGRDADEDLADLLIALHDFARSLPDPQAWLEQAKQKYRDAEKARRLDDLFWFPAYKDHIRRELETAAMEFQFAIQAFAGTPFEKPYGTTVRGNLDIVRAWIEGIKEGKLENLCREIREHKFDRLGRASNVDEDEKREAQSVANRGKERIQKKLQEGLCLDDFDSMLRIMAEAEPHVTFLLDLVEEFQRKFKEEKERLAVVDFSDLEQLMLELLRDREVAGSLQDRFEYILVDEYQDINPIQDEILRAVSRTGDAKRPNNLFMVGDVKQSIYRFRLAEPEIFAKKYESYSDKDNTDKLRIYLKENFRSRKGIIAAVNAIFARIMQENIFGMAYDESARLEYGADYPDEKAKNVPVVEFHVLDIPKRQKSADAQDSEKDNDSTSEESALPEDLDKIELEARFVADRIAQMAGGEKVEFQVYEPREGRYRDVRYRDIVVLLRSTRDRALTYCEALADRGIPVYSDLATGYFASMEIEDMLNLLRVIDNPRQDISLASVLRSPIVGLREPDLAEIRLARGEGDFYLALAAAAKREDVLGSTIKKLLQDLNKWRTAARQRPLAQLISMLYTDTGYLNYVAGLRNGAQRQANLLRLHDRACQFDQFAHHGLARFLRFIEGLLEAGSDFGSAPVLSEAEDAVRVMSIHKSKGLEFPVVFLPDLAKGINFEDTRGDLLYDREMFIGAKVINLERGVKYSGLSHMVVSRQLKAHTIAEEMRVLYVAMTRAKERLILSAAAGVDATKNKWEPIVRGTDELPSFVPGEAASMLDWIWPAAAGIEGGEALRKEGPHASENAFMRVTIHSAEKVSEFLPRQPDSLSPGIDKKKIENLAPLDGVRGASDAVRQAAEQIAWSYPAAELIHVRAKMSVSELKHRHDTSREADDMAARRRERLTEQPAFLMKGEQPLRGAARGTAAHIVMRHLDLSEDLTESAKVEAQIRALKKRRLLTDAEADSVDAEVIAAFFRSELGRQMLEAPNRVRRELPFTRAVRAGVIYPNLPENQREEIILLQGIIDCLIEEDDGFRMIDFKTDEVPPEELMRRIEEGGYKTQLSHYAEAVEEIFGKPVREKHLYFLSLGKSVSC